MYRGRNGDPGYDQGYHGPPGPGYGDPYNGRPPSQRNSYNDDRYGDPYKRDDPYTRGGKGNHSNGYARDSSYLPPERMMEDGPAFEVDHLATFTVGPRQAGMMFPEDGMRRLHEMEKSSGIWTMRCILIIERHDLVILEPRPGARDRLDGDEMERFPLDLVSDPTAITPAERGSVYDNILTFTVVEDPRKASPSEMHLFQILNRSAREVVDEIKMAKAGQGRDIPYRGPAPGPSGVRDRVATYEHQAEQAARATQAYQPASRPNPSYRKSYDNDNSSTISERTDRSVQLLNRCFDDIERFVARLQMAADAYRELDRRRVARGRPKDRKAGDGMLSMRARPPPAGEFINIFQKFKLAFNLLAKLESYIHDPNAPELVHFLFTPLSLIVETSKDPRNGSPDLPSRVVAPLLTREAKELLLHCLTSTESNLWMSLGDSWTVSRDEWKGYVPPYVPRFSDDWEPPLSWLDDDTNMALAAAVQAHSDQIHRRNQREDEVRRAEERVMPYPRPEDRPYGDTYYRDQQERGDQGHDLYGRSLPVARNQQQQGPRREDEAYPYRDSDPAYPPRDDGYPRRDESFSRRAEDQPYPRRDEPYRKGQEAAPLQRSSGPKSWEDQQQMFAADLRTKGAKMVEATHDRQGRNQRELTVRKGEILEVIDDSKNWWKLRNASGEVAHAPYTILQDSSSGAKSADVYDPPLDEVDSGLIGATHSQPPRRESNPPDPNYESVDNPTNPVSPAPQRTNSPSRNAVTDEELYARVLRKPSEKDPHRGRVVMRQKDRALQAELRETMNNDRGLSRQAERVSRGSYYGSVNINQESNSEQVMEWLQSKGFQDRTVMLLRGLNGADLFRMTKHELEQLCRQEEGARLYSQLTVQKNIAGYDEAKSSELTKILKVMKNKSDQDGSGDGKVDESTLPTADYRRDSPQQDYRRSAEQTTIPAADYSTAIQDKNFAGY